MSGPDSAP